jgi:hypothetical protein
MTVIAGLSVIRFSAVPLRIGISNVVRGRELISSFFTASLVCKLIILRKAVLSEKSGATPARFPRYGNAHQDNSPICGAMVVKFALLLFFQLFQSLPNFPLVCCGREFRRFFLGVLAVSDKSASLAIAKNKFKKLARLLVHMSLKS